MAGLGTGTGYVGLVNLLPPDFVIMHDALLLAAPAITVGTAFVWAFAAAWTVKKATTWQLDGAIRECEQLNAKFQADQACGRIEKANAKRALSELRAMKVDLIKGHVADVRARLKRLS